MSNLIIDLMVLFCLSLDYTCRTLTVNNLTLNSTTHNLDNKLLHSLHILEINQSFALIAFC